MKPQGLKFSASMLPFFIVSICLAADDNRLDNEDSKLLEHLEA